MIKQGNLFDVKPYDPDSGGYADRAKADALERAGFPRFHRDPATGIPKVMQIPEEPSPQVATPPTSHDDRRRQAYMILTDEPIITARSGLLERLTNAAVCAGMRVDFKQGRVRGVQFVDTSLESMDCRVVRGSYGFQLPKEFERARRVYDDVVRRLK